MTGGVHPHHLVVARQVDGHAAPRPTGLGEAVDEDQAGPPTVDLGVEHGAIGGTVDVAATFCATVVDEWVRAGVTDAVVAPGSRSTPMVLALAGDARIRLHVFLDERSAAFFALGSGCATGDPAPVLTTSGTAAAELHPAVVEAHHAGVPLLVVTADRPPEAHGVGAPQTIEQADLYGRAVRWRADPGVPDPAVAHSWRSLASRAVAEARGCGGRPGPVHLNLAFREPLVGRPGPAPSGPPGGQRLAPGAVRPGGGAARPSTSWPGGCRVGRG